MNSTIVVKGTGTASATPDYIKIPMELETCQYTYENTMDSAASSISRIQEQLQALGFEKDALKTTSFNIQADYEHLKNSQGNYYKQFQGFRCRHDLLLSFDFDPAVLGDVLNAIASLNLNLEMSITFTVKDPTGISETLLANAAADAKRKAQVLCAATGALLGNIISIDYNWKEIDFTADLRINYGVSEMGDTKCKAPEMNPEDIKLQDTVTFVWELLDNNK